MDLDDTVRALQATAQSRGHGWTALHVAAELGRVDACRALLGLGLSADARTEDGARPLDLAVAGGHPDAAEVLLHHHRERAMRTALANRGDLGVGCRPGPLHRLLRWLRRRVRRDGRDHPFPNSRT